MKTEELIENASATEILHQDHENVKELFEEFEKAGESEKGEIVQKAIQELKIHTAIEEEIFYPEVREETSQDDLMDEALEEHHVVDLLISELESMEPGDERYDAKFKVLSESVKRHIEEEESEVFPQFSDLDANHGEIAERMMERKQELMEEAQGGEPEKKSRSGAKSSKKRSSKKSHK